jgi:5'-nucleotidase
MISHGEQFAKQVAKSTILLKNGVVSNITNEMINLSTFKGEADPIVAEKIRVYMDDPSLKKAFATLKYGIPDFRKLGYMMTDAARTALKTDFSLINCTGIRLDFLPAGPVTVSDIFLLSPFNNNYFVVVNVKQSDIKNFIETVYRAGGINCLLMPSGLNYTARQISEQEISVEKMTLPNGDLLDEHKTYTLVVGSFLHSQYLKNYDVLGDGDSKPQFVVNVLIDYLLNNPDIDYPSMPVRERKSN